MFLLSKTCPKRLLPQKGGSLSAENVLQKTNFLGVGEDFAGGASARPRSSVVAEGLVAGYLVAEPAAFRHSPVAHLRQKSMLRSTNRSFSLL
jgi:hypothetical protein